MTCYSDHYQFTYISSVSPSYWLYSHNHWRKITHTLSFFCSYLSFLGTTSIGFVHALQPWTSGQSWTLLSSIVIGPRFEQLYKPIPTSPSTQHVGVMGYHYCTPKLSSILLFSFAPLKSHTPSHLPCRESQFLKTNLRGPTVLIVAL